MRNIRALLFGLAILAGQRFAFAQVLADDEPIPGPDNRVLIVERYDHVFLLVEYDPDEPQYATRLVLFTRGVLLVAHRHLCETMLWHLGTSNPYVEWAEYDCHRVIHF